ncbi:hypothetical protein [Catellatospora sichuanensis]|uniref:hypothetical protein n=1 Tax=Catellatospora sichuanensis TaxID=1969805 RepID=UPI001FE80CB7|nr:hypothetical protein [Catellatospora sichuanensis]
MRRNSRAAAVIDAAVLLLSGASGTAGEKSLSQPAAAASTTGRGPAPLTTDRRRSRSRATLGKDCQ